MLVKIDPDGDVIWTKFYGGPHIDRIYAIDLVSDGGYIVVGESKSFDPENDMRPWIIRFDSIGNIIWQKTYVQLGDFPREVLEISDGSFIVGGGSGNAFIWKINPSGDLIWDRTYDYGVTYNMLPTDDGGFIAAVPGPGVAKFDEYGNNTWYKRYAPSGASKDIFKTSDGNYILTGHTYPYILIG